MDIFWEENSAKEIKVGEGCFNRILSNNKEKINIYQSFFGKSSSSRVSAIGRNSVFNRNSFIRASVVDNTGTDSMSMSFLKNIN
jgi:hypothetical protein